MYRVFISWTFALFLCIASLFGQHGARFQHLLEQCGGSQDGTYRVLPQLYAASFLQKLGEEKGGELLLEYAGTQKYDQEIIILCRMLYVPESGEEFRRPMIGAAHFLAGTDYVDWPLEPIEIVDGVPFLVVQGYSLGGQPELAEMYLEYCFDNCKWNPINYSIPGKQELQDAFEVLTSVFLKKGKSLNKYERAFLENQIK